MYSVCVCVHVSAYHNVAVSCYLYSITCIVNCLLQCRREPVWKEEKERKGGGGRAREKSKRGQGRGGGGVEKRSNCMCREKKGWEKGLT